MTPAEFYGAIVRPALVFLESVAGVPVSDAAGRMLLAIALQESRARARFQVLESGHPGAARGFLQFEVGGGVAAVMRHQGVADRAKALCGACLVNWERHAIWRALEGHDALAFGFGRLLLLTDPPPLPLTEKPAWSCYLRLWRPGKPHPDAWPANWAAALAAVPLRSR